MMVIQARKRIVNTLDLIWLQEEDEKVGSDDAFMLLDTEIKDNISTMIIAGQKKAFLNSDSYYTPRKFYYTQICCGTISF